jgi:Ca2+-binding EF-hand superfamily protein
MRYADHTGKLSVGDFQECLSELFSKFGVTCRKEEVAVIAAKASTANETGQDLMLRPDDFVRFCSVEAERQDWTLASSRIKRVVQKALLAGIDVEHLLSERDTQGHHTLSVEEFRLFWKDMQRFGKIQSKDVMVILAHFSKRDTSAKSIGTVVHIPEVASFLGIKYVGNHLVKLRNLICSENQRAGATSQFKVSPSRLSALCGISASKSNSKELIGEKCRAVLSYEALEQRLEELGVYSELGHEQLRKILIAAGESAGRTTTNGLSVMDLLTHLKIDTSGIFVPPVSSMGVEELLKLLLDRAGQDGAAIDQAFRHFDADGDGTITEAELLKGLSDLHIFDTIPNWQQQVPSIVAKFDSSGDGAVSLNEFFAYLGSEKYLPNIMQRMTKIFATCNVPLQTIFASFDVKGVGSITSTELQTGLNEIGGFQEISEGDIASITSFFDSDGDGQISLEEFISYFSDRIKQAKRDLKAKKAQRLQRRVRDVLKAVVEDGGSFEQLFSHFDKDGDGSITREEMSSGLRSIPHFKSLTDGDVKDLVQVLDADDSDSISMEVCTEHTNSTRC